VGWLCDVAKVGELMESENQPSLFDQAQSEEKATEPDSPDKPHPGAFWNGKIWVSDGDLAF